MTTTLTKPSIERVEHSLDAWIENNEDLGRDGVPGETEALAQHIVNNWAACETFLLSKVLEASKAALAVIPYHIDCQGLEHCQRRTQPTCGIKELNDLQASISMLEKNVTI